MAAPGDYKGGRVRFLAHKSPFTLGFLTTVIVTGGAALGYFALQQVRLYEFCDNYWCNMNSALASYRASVAAALHQGVDVAVARDIINDRRPFDTTGPHIDLRAKTLVAVDPTNFRELRLTISGPVNVLRALRQHLAQGKDIRIISEPLPHFTPYFTPFGTAAPKLVVGVGVDGLPQQIVDKLATKVADAAP